MKLKKITPIPPSSRACFTPNTLKQSAPVSVMTQLSLISLMLPSSLIFAEAITYPPHQVSDSNTAFYEQKGWQLVWSDEFDAPMLDREKWAFEENCWGGGNNELQCYVDAPENAFIQDGVLHIKALRQSHTGTVYNPDSADYKADDLKTQPWTSARLRSISPLPFVQSDSSVAPSDGQNTSNPFNFRHDWTYGRFEIRAKLPAGQGTWPAVWMLPTDWVYGGWAMSGEIDIMEAVNLKADRTLPSGEIVPENRVHGTLHYGRAWPGNVYTGAEYDFGDLSLNPADNFHTYALEWEAGEIRWYIDGVHYATQTQDGWYTHFQAADGEWQSSASTDAPFNQPFHLIMNLAIGGAWAGTVNEGGVDEALKEAELLIDYVRVYQCASEVSGKACATQGEEGSFARVSGTQEPVLPQAADFNADTLAVFDEGVLRGDWQMAKWDDADGGDVYVINDGYIDLQFDRTGVMYLYSNQGKLDDFTPYSGEYQFKMRWVKGDAQGLKVGINDANGQFAYVQVNAERFGAIGAQEWTQVSIPVQQMLDAVPDFDLTRVNMSGKFEQADGVDLHVQIKDIQLTKRD